jgi:CxxC motif-containing protein (DUF1111 family)
VPKGNKRKINPSEANAAPFRHPYKYDSVVAKQYGGKRLFAVLREWIMEFRSCIAPFRKDAIMKLRYLLCYLAGAVLTFTPVGLRVLSWSSNKEAPDPDMVRAGKMLFEHEWTPHDPLSPSGDGLGPVYNANSCVACHRQGGSGGGGERAHNVTTFSLQKPGAAPREGVLHAQAWPGFRETVAGIDPTFANGGLRRTRRPGEFVLPANPQAVVRLSQRNTPALFGAGLIDELPDRVIVGQERKQQIRWGGKKGLDAPVGRASRLPDGRIGKFGWKGQSASLADFVQAACANELGLGNPGSAQPAPLGKRDYQPPGLDLTLEQCNQLTAYIADLPRPEERGPADVCLAAEGKRLFTKIGCADCHTPSLGSVDSIYSDLLLHRMGEKLESAGGGYNAPSLAPPASPGDGPPQDEWRTPPLWGVADSAPYLHDGQAASLQAAIKLHGGQAARSARLFETLLPVQQNQVIAFLMTLRAP